MCVPAFAGEPLGPSGMVPVEPFSITADYQADFLNADPCEDRPADLELVKIGDRAVYGVTGDEVTVFLDEYARRMALDYCWN